MSDDWDDNVVPFPRGQFERAQNKREADYEELPVRRQRTIIPTCEHERVWVNEADRTVTCRTCEVALDPIDVLGKIAHRREFLVAQGRNLRSEAEHLAKEVGKLKRDEKNAKARLRNAEHPALKEARQALKDAERVLWDAGDAFRKLGLNASDSKLYARVMSAASRVRRAAEALSPMNADSA